MSPRFSKRYPTYLDWYERALDKYAHGRMTQKNFLRVVNGHFNHPSWTLDELQGRRSKKRFERKWFNCNLVTAFSTHARGRIQEAYLEIWVEGMILVDVDGSEEFWDMFTDHLDDKLSRDSVVGWVYETNITQTESNSERVDIRFPPYWGLEIEGSDKKEECLDVDVTVFRRSKEICKTRLKLTWIGSRLTIT